MGLSSEIISSGIGEGAGVGKSTIGYITAGVAAIGIALKSFTIIPEGSVGVKTRFGKARRHKKGDLAGEPIIKGAGAHATFPGVHSYRVINVRRRASDLEPSFVDVDNRGISEKRALRASITWRVSDKHDDPYKALFEVEDGSLEQSVTNICLGGLRLTIEEHGRAITNQPELLHAETNAHIREPLGLIGVNLEAIQIKDTTQSEGQAVGNAIQSASPDNPLPNIAAIAAVHLAAEENIA